MKRFGITTLVVALLGCLVGGCAGTSAPFQYTAHQAGPFLADVTRQYVEHDAAIDPGLKSARLADAAALTAATQDQAAIDFQTVADKWAALKPTFYLYTENDPALDFRPRPTDATMRDVYRMPAAKLDQAITEEGVRRQKWHPFAIGGQ